MAIKKAQKGYPLKGIETPTPGSENGRRGVPVSKNIQDGIKSGKLNKDGTTKNSLPKKKMGGVVKKKMQMGGESNAFTIPSKNKISIPKKAQDGTKFGMLSVKAKVDNNPGITAADRIAGARMKKGEAKKGASMKKCKYGCK